MVARDIRVLLAEDSSVDAELELRVLAQAGFRVVQKVVHAAEPFALALLGFRPDVILADFGMPGFSGLQALEAARRLQPLVPFIFVSGTIGEERAIEALKQGATDYVLKSNLARLPAAVERALAQAHEREERSRLAEALRESQAGLMRAQLMARLAHVVTGAHGAFERWSETLPGLIGVESPGVPRTAREWLELVHPEDRAAFRAAALRSRATGSRKEVAYRFRRGDGSWIHLQQTMEPLLQSPNGNVRWFNTLQDVSAQKAAERRIARLNRLYAVLSGINSAIVRIRERQALFEEACRIAIEAGRFVMAWIGVVDPHHSLVTPVATAGEVRGFFDAAPMAILESKPGGHGLAGRAIRSRLPVVSNDIRSDPQKLMRKELDERGINSLAIIPLVVGDTAVGVLALYAADVEFFDEEEMRLLKELGGDISFALDHIEKAERLDYLSYYDPLTGLANRTLFHERLRLQLEVAAREQARVALLVLDVERFKTINDTLGRVAGDALLVELARRIRQDAHPATWAARIGADHFALVVPELATEGELARRIEKLFAGIFTAPFAASGMQLRVSARIGIALSPSDGADAEELLRNAEAALKKAKASGERYLFYMQQMTERVAEKLSLENKLREALEREEFVLHYQPKVDPGRAIVGVEALIRWQRPEVGLVPPMQFIPLLEETGLIMPVGSWALERAARDRRGWVERKLAAPRIAVNVSAIQLRQRNFVDIVRRAVGEGLVPAGIDLEITESLIMEDIQANIEKLKAVQALGMTIAIDDFGTGYSSLSYLAELPVHALKIDRSFICKLKRDPNATTLVSTIIALAHSLRLKVIAEGVETEEQAETLRLLHCDEMQGYLFSKPLAAAQLEALLLAGGRDRTNS